VNVLVQIRDDGLREDVVEVARGAGWATHEARTPDELVARVEECGARALVLEVHDHHCLDAVRRLAADVAVVAIGHETGLEQRVAVLRHGARAFLRKPFDAAALEHALVRAVPREGGLPGLEARADDDALVARDPCTMRLRARLESAAASDATVRILGETGTGKRWLARHLHQRSARSRGPLVVVSCAGLSAASAKRELFGRGDVALEDRGHGRVSVARGGTLVLANVDELPPALEPALLRLLLEREPGAGGARQVAEDARIVATARGEAASRSAVIDRLDVITLRVPPLRERPDDLPVLAGVLLAHFARLAGEPAPTLAAEAVDWLSARPWRGNVRELENLMRRAVLLHPGRRLAPEHLASLSSSERATGIAPSLDLRELERSAVERALELAGGNRTHAARALGISVRGLRNKIRRFGLG